MNVAPYRILDRIGAGGMGEVFLAADDRLGRRVAIKRIRPDRDRGAEARERLRREARYAAGIRHSAIVQVHDILERDDALYVVMEWIEGEDLRHRIQSQGALDIAQVIRLGRQLASGLAEAHQRGIVHRDFKAENVLIDTAGQVKITDFGIAKRLCTNPATADSEETLTHKEAVLGTYRVLSPEQVLSEPVDPRSDLFSLGVLLYEALTGESPFGAANDMTTLRRIVESEPLPVATLRPDVPPALAALVGRLLAKDPNLRPRSAREVELDLAELDRSRRGEESGLGSTEETVYAGSPDRRPQDRRPPSRRSAVSPWRWLGAAAALVLVAGLGWFALVDRWNEPAVGVGSPVYVAAMPPVLGFGAPEAGESSSGAAEIFSEAVRVAVVRTLISLDRVSPRATAEIDRAEGDALEIAHSLAVEELMTATILWRSELAHVTLNRLRAVDGVVLWSDSFETSTDDLVLVLRAVTGLVQAAYPDRAVRRNLPNLDVEPADLRRFLELRRRFSERLDPAGDETLAGLRALRATSPDFVDIDLQIAEIALHRFYDSRDPQHLQSAEQAMERAERLAPGDPRVLRYRVFVDSEAGRPAAARRALERLAAELPGDLQVDDMRARLLRREGHASEAAALLRRVARLQPSVRRLVTLARLEIDLGEIDAARSHLRTALDRAAGDYEALSLLAQLELTVGDPAAAAELYGRLVERSAGTSELSNLGLAQLLLGRSEQAAEHFAAAVDLEPRNPFFLLNLADASWIAGDRQGALDAYRGVVELVRQDSAADRPQFLTVEAQALAHLGEHQQAVSAVQRALVQAPESASVSYEAALVYAVVGEETSALVQAEAALARGVEPRWFDFPWFDELRRRDDFQTLLAAAGGGRPG